MFNLLTLIFLAASVMLLVFHRFSHPAIPAYILSGIFLGQFIDGSNIIFLIEFGIGFLVFIFGANTETGRIKSVASESAATTFVQVAVIGTIAYLTGTGMGLDSLNAFYFATAASLSSSLVGLEMLESQIRIDILHGRLAESIHLTQDLIAIGGILIITSTSFTHGAVSSNIARSLVLLVGALAFRQFVFPRVARQTRGSTEMMMLLSLGILALFVGGSELLGISFIVGSFTAGIAVAKFPHNLEVLEVMSSFKDFFSAIFFVSLGSLLSFPTPAVLSIAVFLTIATLFVKPAITALSLLYAGYDTRTAYLTGLSLDQVSEFGLIVAIAGLLSGSIHPGLFDAIIIAAATTMVVSSYTTRHQEQIYRRISQYGLIETSKKKIEERTGVKEDIGGHVIVLGYDPQGRRISEELEDENRDFIVIENDPEKITEVEKNHDNYVFGDAMDQGVWENARFESADLIISTVPVIQVSRRIMELDTGADKILRAESVDDAAELIDLGALYVEVPDIAASEQLIDHIRGVIENRNYAEELRRRKLLELRRYTRDEES